MDREDRLGETDGALTDVHFDKGIHHAPTASNEQDIDTPPQHRRLANLATPPHASHLDHGYISDVYVPLGGAVAGSALPTPAPGDTPPSGARGADYGGASETSTLPFGHARGNASTSLQVTSDATDYEPGSTATFTITGVHTGASVTIDIADVAGHPGLNGVVDIYPSFTVTDGGVGDLDGLANGRITTTWQVPNNGTATGATLQLTALSGPQTGTLVFTDAANRIVTENQKAGTPESVWAIHGSIANQGDSQIEGFATKISVNAGQTVQFKIDTSANGYKLDIYRLGYYGGDGARLITSMQHTGATNQPNPTFNSATRTVDAGNWSVTDSWAIPTDAVSGVYFAKLTSNTGDFENIIPFIVRNDGTASDLLFQTSDTTWEAYNPWGGYNLYQGPNGQADRAYAVSYNRPIDINSSANEAGPQDFLFGEEYAAIYWLEQNGYNVGYISGIDAATNGSLLLNAKTYVDVGHDEYWTQSQYNNVKAAADAGVNLAFLSGNNIYWDIGLAPDVNGVANRTVVEYKDLWDGTQLDPTWVPGSDGTGTFRDPVYGPGLPENSLAGNIFTVDDIHTLNNITVPAALSQLRFWRNTSIASGNGGTLKGLLGYEWNSDLDNGFRPIGTVDLSSTTMNVGTLLLDNGATVGNGTATHSLTLYRDTVSGALIFGAGTVMWSWGLSDQYAPYQGITSTPVSTAVQQAMVNLFADFGVQPQTLQASLILATASTDTTPPVALITSPIGGTTFSQGASVTITGTATDVGGRVAGVEVSTDGGQTWHPASGTSSWTYTWNATNAGTTLIEAKAVDDSINLQATPSTVSVTVNGVAAGPSLFSAADTPAQTNLNDGQSIELGVRFQSTVAGQITALKFYRSTADGAADTLDLWSASGVLLATVSFANTSASGWQTVNLTSPVNIAANTPYIASYHTTGAYVATQNFFTSTVTSGNLSAPAASNGVYAYGSGATFPNQTFSATNYWADVVFASSVNVAPVANNDNLSGRQNTPATVTAATLLANDTDANGDTLSLTGVSNAVNGSVALANGIVTFTPTTGYTGPASFQYAISDGRGGSATGTVSVTVTANIAPVANADTLSVRQNSSGTVAAATLLANDTDANGDTLALTGVSSAVNGTVSLANNVVTFTPTAGYTGPASFQYAISDGFGGTATGSVNVTVGANTPPVANADSGFTTQAGTPLAIAAASLLANDTDANGDTLTVTGVGSAVNGTTSFANNTVTFTPTAGYTGPASFQYTISDGFGGTATGNVSLTVTAPPTTFRIFSATSTPSQTNVNDTSSVELGVEFTASVAGQITQIMFYKGTQDTGTHTAHLWTATGTLLATATFTSETASGWQTATLSTPITLTAGTTYVASYHTSGHYSDTQNYFTVATATGPLTTPVSAGVYAYGTGSPFPTSTWNASNYWVDVTFQTTPNSPPVAGTDTQTTNQNGSLAIPVATLLANDTDPNGDTLSITSVGSPVNGAVSLANNVVTFTPAAGYAGPASFQYTVSDGKGGTATGLVNVTVTVNQNPVANTDTGTSVIGAPVSFAAATLLANDTDANGDSLSVTGVLNPVNGSVTFASNIATFTPTAGYAGSASFQYTISDGHGGTAIGTVNIAVTANSPPVANADSFTVRQNTALAIQATSLTANDTDPNNDALTLTGAINPVNGTVAFANNVVTFTPTTGYAGSAAFQYTISDGHGGTATGNVSLNVIADTPPVANADSGFTTKAGTPLAISAATLLANDTDANGDALTLTGVSGALNGTVALANNVVTFTPTAGYSGAASFQYTISDGYGGGATGNVSLTVNPITSYRLFSTTSTPSLTNINDTNSVELGVEFSASTSGQITQIMFYKGTQDTGTHTAHLWTATGTLLATATFTNETASGWQTATLSTPVAITAGTTYVASYHTSGHYAATPQGFASATTSGPLTAPANAGVYAYGSSALLPTNTYNANNYWVDVTLAA